MAWLDLAIICLLLWGGITGYLSGWKQTAGRLAAVAAVAGVAIFFLGDTKAVLFGHYPVEETIKAVIYSRLAVPVTVPPQPVILPALALPPVLHAPLLKGLSLSATPDFILLVDLLARVVLNVIAFCASLILWWGLIYLLSVIWLGRSRAGESRWIGALLGVVRQYLVVALIIGTAVPLIWLAGLPGEIMHLENTFLARWSLELYSYTGIWWK
jgi:hypothetical protein